MTDHADAGTGDMSMLALYYIAAFIASLNEIVINVALVGIMEAFSIDSVTAQWLVTGYMIVTVVIVASIAFLSTRFSLRALSLAGALFFIVGSVGAMAAPSFAILLVARLVQAVGSGIFIPTMMNVVLAVAPRKRLGTYFSIGGSCVVLGPAFGPIIAGAMVTLGGWRAVFAPGCAAFALLLIVGIFVVRNVSVPERVRLDAVSVLTVAAGLSLCSFGLTRLISSTALGVITLIAGAAFIASFAHRQLRIADPLLNVRPLANSGFWPMCCLVVIAMMTTFSLSVLIPLHFEGELQLSPLVVGLVLLIPVGVNALTALAGGRILDRHGVWPLLPGGFALIAGGFVLLLAASRTGSVELMIAASIPVFSGVGLVFSPSQTAGLSTLDPEENPHGVALVNVCIQMAGCIGPALYVGIYASKGFSVALAIALAVAGAGLAIAVVYSLKRRTA